MVIQPTRPKAQRSWSFSILALVAASFGILLRQMWRLGHRRARLLGEPGPDLDQFQGLTEAEAAERLPPSLAQNREQDSQQVRKDIWSSSTFSIFNMSMLGLAVVQWLLDDSLSALLTIGIMFFNIGVNAAQQLYATGQVEALLERTKPMATAIRDGRIRSITVDEIVVDDLLVAGAGDQFLTGGELLSGRPLVVDPARASGQDRVHKRAIGDPVREGSYCLHGRAIYKVTTPPSDNSANRWTPVQDKGELTQLQRIIARILRLMLLLIAVFLALLFLDMVNFPIISTLITPQYRETASVFFSIAPSGLFFMIVATYAIGSARLGEEGALIRDSRAVESLGQISVLCISKTGALTGAQLHLEMVSPPEGQPALGESLARGVLGDFARSVRTDNVFLQAIADNLPGTSRPVEQTAQFQSAYGWSGVTFAQADIRGTYIIGEPAILEPFLVNQEETPEDTAGNGQEVSPLRGSLNRITGFFSNTFGGGDNTNSGDAVSRVDTDDSDVGAAYSDVGAEPASTSRNEAEEEGRSNLFQRLQYRLRDLASTDRQDETEGEAGKEPANIQPQLMFAYTADPGPLFDDDNLPKLPRALTPICLLRFEEKIRPEAREAVSAFAESGVDIKILSSDVPERVLATAKELGLAPAAKTNHSVGQNYRTVGPEAVSGLEMAGMDEPSFESSASEMRIFYQLTPDQKSDIVRSLRLNGERVAMVGDGIEDVVAMEEANLRITLHGSSQAALNLADIVLLEDSFDVLPTVLQRGQRIVNGMLDIIKINLVQVGYISLLIVAMFIAGRRIFYYHPTHGGIIAFFTVVVPSLGLTFWASSGTLPRQYMRSRLVHFVVPGALSIFAAALVVTLFFNRSIANIEISNMAVTHEIIVIGLLLVVFVQPPARFWVGGDVFSGDWRNTYLAFVLLILFIVATYWPLTQQLFRLQPLSNTREYLIIAGIALVWTLIVRVIWRAPWLNRYVGILTDQLERS